MREPDKIIKALFQTIEKSISDFSQHMAGIQEGALDSMLNELQTLETRGGLILNNVENLRVIGKLKNKLEQFILTEGYRQAVGQFISMFDVVADLHIQYFKSFNLKFKPSKTLPIIKELAVGQTLNGLIGQGLDVNVLEPVAKVLQDNITTGGSIAKLAKELKTNIVGEDDNGILNRNNKTVVTDAVNQYSAQYHETLAADLNLNWGRYIGSNIQTTREFCDRLTAKEWVHKSELPKIVTGDIDGEQCRLSKSTGLPLGMIPGTNADNFKVRRGGYNCGHQFYWVPDAVVPADVKARMAA